MITGSNHIMKKLLSCILAVVLAIGCALPCAAAKVYADEEPLTRRDFATIIVDLLNLEYEEYMAGVVSFSDVDPSLEEYEAIITSCYYGYYGGFSNGTFLPDAVLSRASAATLLCGAAGIDTASAAYEPVPVDVSGYDWFYDYMCGALQNGFMSVDSDNRFNPDMAVYLSDIDMSAVRSAISSAALRVFSFDASTGTITGYTGSKSIVIIPSEIDGVAVTKIAPLGMQGSIAKLVIPASVTELVGTNTFGLCWNLESFVVNSQNTAFSAKDGVLFSKDGSVLVRFPRGISGAYTVPDGVVQIARHAFCDVFDIPSVVLPAGVTTIGADAFNTIL